MFVPTIFKLFKNEVEMVNSSEGILKIGFQQKNPSKKKFAFWRDFKIEETLFIH
jgi:hypothetical protein